MFTPPNRVTIIQTDTGATPAAVVESENADDADTADRTHTANVL